MRVKKPYSQDVYDVGGRINELRKKKGLSQFDLGNRTDIASNTISRYELSEREMGISVLFKVADALEVTPNDLAPDRFRVQEARQADPEEEQLLALFRRMGSGDKANLLRMAQLMNQDYERKQK